MRDFSYKCKNCITKNSGLIGNNQENNVEGRSRNSTRSLVLQQVQNRKETTVRQGKTLRDNDLFFFIRASIPFRFNRQNIPQNKMRETRKYKETRELAFSNRNKEKS